MAKKYKGKEKKEVKTVAVEEVKNDSREDMKDDASPAYDSSFDPKMIAFRFWGFIILFLLITLLSLDLALTPPIAKWLTDQELVEGWEERKHFLWASVSWGLVTTLFVALVLLNFVRWVFVKESTAMAVMRSGAHARTLLSKVGHRLQEQNILGADGKITTYAGELVEDPNYRYAFWGMEWLGSLLGGLRFYIWLLEYVYSYDWDWLKSMPNGQIVPKHAENENHILVGYAYPYGMKMGEGVFTSDNLPIDAEVILVAEVTRPGAALFNTKWFELYMADLRPPIKQYINSHAYEEIRTTAAKTKKVEELFEDLKARGIVEILRAKFGIRLLRAEFSRFDLTKEHQDLLLKEKEGQMYAKKRTASTTGAFQEMLIQEILGGFTGTTSADKEAYEKKIVALRKEYFDNPIAFELKYAAAIERSRQWINRQIDAEAGALRSFHFQGASGGMDIIAAAAELFRGMGGPGNGNAPLSITQEGDAGKDVGKSSKKGRKFPWET